MHVLITTDTVGGVWTYAQELVTGLIRRGDRVTLVSWGGMPTPSQTGWMRELTNLDYRPTEYRLEWMQNSEQDIEDSRRYLKQLIVETQPDLLHLSQFCYGNIQAPMPRVVVAHSDVMSWWREVRGEEPTDSPWMTWYRETVTRGIAGADVVVAPSGWMLDAIRKLYTNPAYGLVVYNGRDPAKFETHTRKEDVVLSVGRLWDRGKQISLFNDFCGSTTVWIAGAANEPGSAAALTLEESEQEGPKPRIWGEQSQENLREMFARASIYAATSRYEPFGLAPVEAAMSKCAIVANDIPVFRELWGSAACYFQTNDGKDLSRLIGVLSSDPELRTHYGESAYQRAIRMFSADRMVEEYRLLYRNVAAAQAVS